MSLFISTNFRRRTNDSYWKKCTKYTKLRVSSLDFYTDTGLGTRGDRRRYPPSLSHGAEPGPELSRTNNHGKFHQQRMR